MDYSYRTFHFLYQCILTIATLVVLTTTDVASIVSTSPIILINGLGGAVLEGKLSHVPKKDTHSYCSKNTKDWFTLWLSLQEISPIAKHCLEDHLIPTFDEENNIFVDAEGVEIRMKDFGGINGIAYLDPSITLNVDSYFEPLIEYLTSESSGSYVVGKNLFGAPYDWRYNPSEIFRRGYYHNLTTLIENVYSSNDNTPVTLITHSMGGPIILDYLQTSNEDKYEINEEWKAKYLHAYVPLSAPFGGALSSLEGMISGDNFGLPIPSDYFRQIQANCPSGLYLLPRALPNLWSKDEILVSTPSKNYTAANLKDIYQDLGLSLGYEAFDFVTRQTLGNAAFEPPSSKVLVYPIYGTNIETTIGGLEYGNDFSSKKIPKVENFIYESEGDGTVNIRSLKRFESWKEVKEYEYEQLLQATVIPNQTHIGVIGDAITFKKITSIVTL